MEKQLFIVDRIEGEYIVLEAPNNKIINIDKKELTDNIKEGDILIKKGNKFILDEVETRIRKERIEKIVKGLWED
ncbi:DUF3006 domain-containing protein [Clostridium carnis]